MWPGLISETKAWGNSLMLEKGRGSHVRKRIQSLPPLPYWSSWRQDPQIGTCGVARSSFLKLNDDPLG